MTFRELSDECWSELPPLRKRLAGRQAVNKLLADAVRELEPERLNACVTPDESIGYRKRLLDRVKRRNTTTDGDGFAIAIFLLTVIAAAVISWLVQRWLNHHFPESQLAAWREELQA